MSTALSSAIQLLARREHGAWELAKKLQQKGFKDAEIVPVIDACQRQGLQNDTRFVEMFLRVRIRQGYGPVRIQQELQSKRIDDELIKSSLQQEQDNWVDYAWAVWQKKYGKRSHLSVGELQKQQRFLLYRGFPNEIIRTIVNLNKAESM